MQRDLQEESGEIKIRTIHQVSFVRALTNRALQIRCLIKKILGNTSDLLTAAATWVSWVLFGDWGAILEEHRTQPYELVQEKRKRKKTFCGKNGSSFYTSPSLTCSRLGRQLKGQDLICYKVL